MASWAPTASSANAGCAYQPISTRVSLPPSVPMASSAHGHNAYHPHNPLPLMHTCPRRRSNRTNPQ